jgi:hypothetical protein
MVHLKILGARKSSPVVHLENVLLISAFEYVLREPIGSCSLNFF